MDVLANIVLGFGVALTLKNILYCFLGVFLGTVVGVLPGIGPVTTVAMLLPISFTLDPVSAMILLAGIYYGAQYGGSTTAILVNIPGERPRSSRRSTATRWRARAGRPAGHRGDRLLLCWLHRDAADLLCGAAACRHRADVRPGRVFLAHGAA